MVQPFGKRGWQFLKKLNVRTSQVVQWLRPCAFTVGGMGSIPGQGTKILHAVWLGQKIKNKLNIWPLYLKLPYDPAILDIYTHMASRMQST